MSHAPVPAMIVLRREKLERAIVVFQALGTTDALEGPALDSATVLIREFKALLAVPVDQVETIGEKVAHVKSQGQTRSHHCHWPGCTQQVPPAKWGCVRHWYALPLHLRNAVWRTYRSGQEVTGTPSKDYLDVADQVQTWIKTQAPR